MLKVFKEFFQEHVSCAGKLRLAVGHNQKAETAEMTEAHQAQNRTWYHQGGSSDFRFKSLDNALDSWLCPGSVLKGEIWPPHAAMPAHGTHLTSLEKCLCGQDPNKDYVTLADNKYSVLNHSVVEWETCRENETLRSSSTG